MDELVQKIVDQLGYPADMVMRSAQARAQADGSSVEAVLAAWSGGEAPAAPAAPAAGAAPAAPAPAPEPVVEAAPSGPVVEVLGPTEEAAAGAEPPEEPEAEEPVQEEEELASSIPRWLVASFIIIPLLALTYAMFSPNGPSCGEGAVLAVDPVTGEAVNCDGSAYGVDQINYAEIGRSVYASNCAACHGANGAGGGLFPGFTGGAVLATFPPGDCQTHLDWVVLGTNGWPDATYGATATAVGSSGGIMPGFGSLSEEDLRSVVLYERVAFGGQPAADAGVDCGLVSADSPQASP